MYSIQQLAKMAGITRRTLHYYDEIGLLKPSRVGENGYRYYGEETVLRLQQILFYRELELPLEEIQLILSDPNFDPLQALKGHKAEIQKRIQRLERLIQTVDHTINHLRGEQSMDDQQLFDVFNEEQQAEYQKEAEQLYDPAIVRASNQRWNRYTKEEKQRIGEEGEAVYKGFVQAMPKGPASPEAQACVTAWRKHLDYFWTPNEEQLLGIAGGYVNDPRFRANFDKIHPQLAEFVYDAVNVYVASRKGK